MRNAYVWGLGEGFKKYAEKILLWSNKDFKINGFIDKNKTDKYNHDLAISPDELGKEDFKKDDIVIITSDIHFVTMAKYATEHWGLAPFQIIPARVFNLPFFDLEKYLYLKTISFSVVCDYCYASMFLAFLGIEYMSPFANVKVGIQRKDYYRLVKDIDKYMSYKPSRNAGGVWRNIDYVGIESRMKYPILWYEDIAIHGFHYENEFKFMEAWEKRRKRFVFDNRIIFKVLYDEYDIEKFNKIDEKKVGIYWGNRTDIKDCICLNLEEVSLYQNAYHFFNDEITRLFASGEILQYADLMAIFADI